MSKKSALASYLEMMDPVVDQYRENFEVFSEMMKSFESIHICLLREIRFKIGCKLRWKKCFDYMKIWFDYFIGIRSEYAFVHYGAIMNDNNFKTFKSYFQKRVTHNSTTNPLVSPQLLKHYNVVSCSNVGIQYTQNANRGSVRLRH